jgi:hypothetical protein
MSAAQKDLIMKLFGSSGPWVASVLLAFLCFYASEMISEFKVMNADMQELKLKVNRIETIMEMKKD